MSLNSGLSSGLLDRVVRRFFRSSSNAEDINPVDEEIDARMANDDGEIHKNLKEIKLANSEQTYRLAEDQRLRLVNNLPPACVKDLHDKGFFIASDENGVWVKFALYQTTGPYAQASIRVPKRGEYDWVVMNFITSHIEDPILGLVVLWLMWSRSPRAFYCVPCNRDSYLGHIFSPEELRRIKVSIAPPIEFGQLVKFFEN